MGNTAAQQVAGWRYDAAGNLLRDDAHPYTYDALNRLTSVTPTYGPTTRATYNGAADG